MNNWYDLAKYCDRVYGVHVDFYEEFFMCPDCDEPIYACDWIFPEDFDVDGKICCPICESQLVDD